MALTIAIGSVAARVFGIAPLLTLGRCDGLALGSLLAIAMYGRQPGPSSELLARVVHVAGSVALSVLCLRFALHDFDPGAGWITDSTYFHFSLIYCYLVYLVTTNSGSIVLAPLRFTVLLYLGKASYSIYLYHLLILAVVPGYCRFDAGITDAIVVAASILAGVLSYELIERPSFFLRQRIKYIYHASASPPTSTPRILTHVAHRT